MNLPNKLTMLRIFLVPVFVFLLLSQVFGDTTKWIALAIFCVACLTDFLDGKIARKYNLITDFGKFMDPLADKAPRLLCLDLLYRPWPHPILVCCHRHRARIRCQRPTLNRRR